MARTCSKCNKKIGILEQHGINRTREIVCLSCYRKLQEEYQQEKELEARKKLEGIIAKAPKIKCPYCEQWFPKLTKEQYRDSAELNVLKWAIVPAWGLAGSLKNKPYIECPHCHMKIMQG